MVLQSSEISLYLANLTHSNFSTVGKGFEDYAEVFLDSSIDGSILMESTTPEDDLVELMEGKSLKNMHKKVLLKKFAELKGIWAYLAKIIPSFHSLSPFFLPGHLFS